MSWREQGRGTTMALEERARYQRFGPVGGVQITKKSWKVSARFLLKVANWTAE